MTPAQKAGLALSACDNRWRARAVAVALGLPADTRCGR
jgi:hypothetical protein